MNIKSLLLGSAAALTVASGAQAADAIMAAQPAPVDYVRVCDAFGTGYFYIPGTETCLKVGGYVRTEASGGQLGGIDTDNDGRGEGLSWHTRFTLTTDTQSNTELGTLHTYTETRFNYNNGDSGFDTLGNAGGSSTSLNFAYIELGGLRVGKTEAEFTRMAYYGHGYAGSVIQDTLVGYGPFDAQQLSYTYKSDSGFAAVVAIEDDNAGSTDSHRASSAPGGPLVDDTDANDNDYIPDPTVGVSYDNGTFGIGVVGAYDESLEEGAVKARADFSFGKFALFLMGAYSTNGDETGEHGCAGNSSITSCGSNHFAVWGGDYAVWGGFSVDLTDKISANTQVSYDDDDNFGAAGNLVFQLVPGFAMTTEVDYVDAGGNDFTSDDHRYKNVDDAWNYQLRFQRNF
ncbi:porin [Pararhizobium mangrovi]|nr:porin [Pararhizobium mangrovi]